MPERKRRELAITRLRSAITNGSHLLHEVDHRSAWMRRLRDLISLHEVDLGGADVISEGERRLIRRCAMITLQLEMMDHKFATLEDEVKAAELDLYQKLTNTLRRSLQALGLSRRARDVTPTDLQEYLRAKAESAG